MKSSIDLDLGNIPPFAGLSSIARQYLRTRLQKCDLPAGLELVHAGQRGQFMAILEQGQVELSWVGGNKQILEAGGSIGEGMMRYGVPSSFTAVTRSPVRLWVIRRVDWVFAGELPPDEIESQVLEVDTSSGGLKPAQPSCEAPPAQVAGQSGVRKASPNRKAMQRTAWVLAAFAILALAFFILSPELPLYISRALVQRALQAGRPDLALFYLWSTSGWQSNQAALYDELGTALYQEGDQSAALSAFTQAVAQDEELASAQNNLGVVLLNQSKIWEAIEHLKIAADLNPGNPQTQYNLGNAWLAAGDMDNAATAYRRAFDLDSGQIDALAAWGGIALQQGDFAAAQSAWETVVAERPDHPTALRGLGAVALLQGQPEQALSYLLAARTASPLDAEIRFYLGMVLEALDEPAEAADSFEQALAYSNDPALSELARAHLQRLQP
jgi:tetratricopeptide (TPR) repeat protein